MDAKERAKALAEKLALHNGDIPWGYARDIEDATAAAIREAEAAEKGRAAALILSGKFCRHADHAQGACRCDELAAAILAPG